MSVGYQTNKWQIPREQMIAQLHALCAINSGTFNLEGQEKMRHALISLFTPVADEIHIYPTPTIKTIDMSGMAINQTCGDALFIRKRPDLKRRVLLAGHMDTVYPLTSPFQALHYLDDQRLNGPGVADMKGGLLVMLHALNTLEQEHMAENLGWDVFINADEEIGSPASQFFYDDHALNYQAALVYEPAMTESGTLARNRRGSGKITLIATGKSAHVGRAFDEGRNAICYLAEIIIAVHQLNDKRSGVTLNIGKIAGGDALNMVPDKAVTKVDVRISQPDDAHWVMHELKRIQRDFTKKDFNLSIFENFGRPVKKINSGTERLYQRIQHHGEKLGLTIDWQDSGGCCDGNNIAQYNVPVLDTLGVRGGKIHSPEEYIILDSLVERTILSTLLLQDLAQHGLEDLQQ